MGDSRKTCEACCLGMFVRWPGSLQSWQVAGGCLSAGASGCWVRETMSREMSCEPAIGWLTKELTSSVSLQVGLTRILEFICCTATLVGALVLS